MCLWIRMWLFTALFFLEEGSLSSLINFPCRHWSQRKKLCPLSNQLLLLTPHSTYFMYTSAQPKLSFLLTVQETGYTNLKFI